MIRASIRCCLITVCALSYFSGSLALASSASIDTRGLSGVVGRDQVLSDAPKIDGFAAADGVVWRLNIDSKQAIFVDEMAEDELGMEVDPLELSEIAAESINNSYVDSPSLMGDGVELEVSSDFHSVYGPSSSVYEDEDYEQLIPDSFSALPEVRGAEGGSVEAVSVNRNAGVRAGDRVSYSSTSRGDFTSEYLVDPLSGLVLRPLSEHSATVPVAERSQGVKEAVYVNYPAGQAFQRGFRSSVSTPLGVNSAGAIIGSGRLYALPSGVSQENLFNVIAENSEANDSGAGQASTTLLNGFNGNTAEIINVPVSTDVLINRNLSEGGSQLRNTRNTRTVVLDSSQAWSARAINATGFSETWSNSGNAEGWVSRDGELTVGQINTFGNPGGALQGTFAAGVLFPQTDSFTVDSVNASGTAGENFLGDYTSVGYWNGWTFDFYAEDVLPSDLIFRITDGSRTFLYNFADQVTSVGAWQQIRILPDPAKFVGGSAFQFFDTVDNVTQIDIQITRNGFGEQDFYVDNFGYTGNQIPEPSTLGFIVVGNLLLILRFQMARRRKRSLLELVDEG